MNMKKLVCLKGQPTKKQEKLTIYIQKLVILGV